MTGSDSIRASFRKARRRGELVDPETGRIRAHPRRAALWLRALIPALARRLADRLEAWQGSPPTPQEIPNTLEELVDTCELISTGQWRSALNLISLDGVHVPVALERAQIVPYVFRAFIRAEQRLHAHFVRCKRYAKHRRFPLVVVEEMLSELARTNAPLKNIVLRHGYSLTAYRRLVDLIWRTSEWKEAYLAARRAKVARLGTRLMDLPDDELLLMGRRGISKAAFAVHSLRPMPERRAEARLYRAARAAADPIYAARQRVRRAQRS